MENVRENSISSDATASIEKCSDFIEFEVSEDLNCPLCLKVFRSPRRLPCSHSFCQDCLQSYIIGTASKSGSRKEFSCSVCRIVISTEDSSVEKWVYVFPLNILVLSLLMKARVKTDLACDVCRADNVTSPVEDVCVVCEEGLCKKCSKAHRNQKILKTHPILKFEDLACKQNIILQNSSLFKCAEHHHSHLELYCKIHELPLCGNCFSNNHRSCSDVVQINSEIPDLSETFKQIKDVSSRLQKLTDINETNLNNIESRVKDLTSEIRTIKVAIINALDDLEKRVKIDGERIYEKERKIVEQIREECNVRITAIRNSNVVLECVSQNATQSQNLLMSRKVKSQLDLFKKQMEVRYKNSDSLDLQLEINPNLTSITHTPRSEIGKLLIKRNDGMKDITDGFKPLKECKAEVAYVKEIKGLDSTCPWYSGVTYLSDKQVMLADCINNRCCLLDSSLNFVTSFHFNDFPFNICVAGDSEIAVYLPCQKKIQFLSVGKGTITDTRTITTKRRCYGLAAVSQDEIIVSGPCDDDKKYYWSIVNLDGKEKYNRKFRGAGSKQTYVTLNAFKTRLFISVLKDDSLHCFGLDGTRHFTYKHRNLLEPQGVAVDRDDNVYLVGSGSRNIFQLSSEGSLIQIIAKEMDKSSLGICFDSNGEMFLLTHFKDSTVSMYGLKDKSG
ncbi:hypothetical protein CHS0354_031974 [Potamilus streckersoni]|uniref:Uncharacterized protein n=1 Tax=Potamilus streckersoni TaxID=2493646 RepID=A0AAE0TMK3_9BIVA|nr:hypothetical protein CHS0354_031974 [Potamilus streckersoni]